MMFVSLNSSTSGVASVAGSATLLEHLRSSPVFSGDRLTRSLVFYAVFCRSFFFFCPFVLFSLAIALSILRFADFDYSFGIFKLFILIFELQIAENNPIFLHLTSNQLNKFSQNFSLFWIYLKCQVYLRIYRLMMFKSVVIYLDILFCIY
jgi:hypothetical protein